MGLNYHDVIARISAAINGLTAESSNCAEANAALRRAVGGLKELDQAGKKPHGNVTLT